MRLKIDVGQGLVPCREEIKNPHPDYFHSLVPVNYPLPEGEGVGVELSVLLPLGEGGNIKADKMNYLDEDRLKNVGQGPRRELGRTVYPLPG
jgi:hypothetical protein